QGAAVFYFLGVMPRPNDQKDLVIILVFEFDGLVHRNGAIDVFLVPQAVYQHGGYFERLAGQQFIHCLAAPKRVVTGMREHFAPEPGLFQSVTTPEFTRASSLHVYVVIVEVGGPPLGFAVTRYLLIKDVGHVDLAERAIV